MPCALTQGYSLDCRDSFGGVREVYVISIDDITTLTIALGVVTVATKATGKRWYRYKLVAHTGEGDEAYTPNRDNGTVTNKQTVKFPINKMTTAVRNELLLLAQSRLLIMVVDENGVAWLYGKDYGLMLGASKANTGKLLADRNGYELVFEGDEKYLAWEVLASIVAVAETPGP